MADTAPTDKAGSAPGAGRTPGWFVLLLAWIAFAGVFFAASKTMVVPPMDVTNGRILELAGKYASFVGIALGLASYLASGLVYLVIRLIRVRALRLAALAVTFLGYAPWLVFGYDLVYLEPRYAEIARAIITYLGKPMLVSAAVVCGVVLLGAVLDATLSRRRRT